MEDPVHEPNARAFVWILIGEFDVYLPEAARERCYGWLVESRPVM